MPDTDTHHPSARAQATICSDPHLIRVLGRYDAPERRLLLLAFERAYLLGVQMTCEVARTLRSGA